MIPIEIFYKAAEESVSLRRFLVERFVVSEENEIYRHQEVLQWRKAFATRAKTFKIEAIKIVRDAKGMDRTRFLTWAAELGKSLENGPGLPHPGLAEAKHFVEAAIINAGV